MVCLVGSIIGKFLASTDDRSRPYTRAYLDFAYRFLSNRDDYSGADNCLVSASFVRAMVDALLLTFGSARQIGADYPFDDPEARRTFNYYGSMMHGWGFWGFRKAKG